MDTEGTFQFSWTLEYSNCSEDDGTDAVTFTRNTTRHSLYFTTKDGTAQPDLAAALDNNICAQSLSQAWNVTNLLDIPDEKSYGGAPSCAAIPSTSPPPVLARSRLAQQLRRVAQPP